MQHDQLSSEELERNVVLIHYLLCEFFLLTQEEIDQLRFCEFAAAESQDSAALYFNLNFQFAFFFEICDTGEYGVCCANSALSGNIPGGGPSHRNPPSAVRGGLGRRPGRERYRHLRAHPPGV